MVRQCKTEEKQCSPGGNTQVNIVTRGLTGTAQVLQLGGQRATWEAQLAGQDWTKIEQQD